ncbi:MAG TPA: hypothetical protein VFV05_09530 [Methylomirabilota bacterium]|nr:hypothetical protein [Methylomirabilota bacterium]
MITRGDIRLIRAYAKLHGQPSDRALFAFKALPPARQAVMRANMRRELKDPEQAAADRELRQAQARHDRALAAELRLQDQAAKEADARVAALRETVT